MPCARSVQASPSTDLWSLSTSPSDHLLFVGGSRSTKCVRFPQTALATVNGCVFDSTCKNVRSSLNCLRKSSSILTALQCTCQGAAQILSTADMHVLNAAFGPDLVKEWSSWILGHCDSNASFVSFRVLACLSPIPRPFRAPPAPACWKKVREFVSRSFCRGRLLWSCLGQAICFSFTSSTPSSRNLFSSVSSFKWSDHAVLVPNRHPKHSQRQEILSPDSHHPKPSHDWLSSSRIIVIFWMLPPWCSNVLAFPLLASLRTLRITLTTSVTSNVTVTSSPSVVIPTSPLARLPETQWIVLRVENRQVYMPSLCGRCRQGHVQLTQRLF